ncbi:MAG TPA: hypothetical protein VHO03_14530 [Ignavibacteriales bacterium]|nr:hypothetical protein [Ignavibacteriales bacterium]
MVNIEGDLTISQIKSIKSEIQESIRQNLPLKIAINGISEMDITFLQLIISLESTSSEVTIAIAPENRGKILEFMETCGCLKELKMLNMEN